MPTTTTKRAAKRPAAKTASKATVPTQRAAKKATPAAPPAKTPSSKGWPKPYSLSARALNAQESNQVAAMLAKRAKDPTVPFNSRGEMKLVMLDNTTYLLFDGKHIVRKVNDSKIAGPGWVIETITGTGKAAKASSDGKAYRSYVDAMRTINAAPALHVAA